MNAKLDQQTKKLKRKRLKINENKTGSVRNVNGKIWLDFRYLGERVREPYHGLPWDGVKGLNAKSAREDLDVVVEGIKKGKFIFAEVFPDSTQKEKFTEIEIRINKRSLRPFDVKIKDYIQIWLNTLRNGDTGGRTLNGYKSINDLYLLPYWGDKTFDFLKASNLADFYAWARKQQYRKNPVSNNSLNMYVSQLIRIGKHAAGTYGWDQFVAFANYQKLEGKDSFEDINPFSFEEQKCLFRKLPPYWRPYCDMAFSSGLSPGELDALFTHHVNMSGKTVTVAQASTLDEDGKRVIAKPKNKFRNRTIKMNKRMRSAIKAQHKLRKKLGIESEYFFCMPDGSQVDRSWLTKNIWKPALEAAGVEYRPLKQARHTYAIMHRSKGEDPLAIAKTLGHCDTTMLEKVYTKYKEKIVGVTVGEEDLVLSDADYGLDELVDLAGSDAFDVNKSSQKETGIWAGIWAKNKKRISKFIANPLKSLVGRIGIEPITY